MQSPNVGDNQFDSIMYFMLNLLRLNNGDSSWTSNIDLLGLLEEFADVRTYFDIIPKLHKINDTNPN